MRLSISRTNTILLLCVALTLLVLVLPNILPDKELVILPKSGTHSYIFTISPTNDGITASWVDQETNTWRCNVEKTGVQYHCSFFIHTLAHPTRGLNFSRYSDLKLKVAYNGSGRRVRIGLRTFDPRFSKLDDTNSAKYHFVVLLREDLNKEVMVSLDDIAVAEWWVMQYGLPLHLARTDLSNVITVAIELVDDLEAGEHVLQVEKITLVGSWIEGEPLYIGIILFWISAVMIFVLMRIAKIKNVNRELLGEKIRYQELSTIDPLTNSFNRAGIEEKVRETLAKSGGKDISLILIDIDHFKKVNDKRGHDAGDRVLKKFAELIFQNIRTRDVFGRWGGEEFILLCPGCSLENALALSEKIRQKISETTFEEHNPLRVTASFGVSMFGPGENFREVFRRADIALYDAKGKGRNCVIGQGATEQ